jgi:hypothetical protein
VKHFDETTPVTYDRSVFDELVSLRFVDAANNAFILGPVGVGKTFIATALGHTACRRRISVHFERHVRLMKWLKEARLDQSYDQELRRLIGIDLLIIDFFCLQPLDATETSDLVVERHHRASTVVTSNRDPSEWLTVMADALLAQSAIDRKRAPPGAHHRGSFLSRQREASAHDGTDLQARSDGPLDREERALDHQESWSRRARGGPMLLATVWSLRTGKRQLM